MRMALGSEREGARQPGRSGPGVGKRQEWRRESAETQVRGWGLEDRDVGREEVIMGQEP